MSRNRSPAVAPNRPRVPRVERAAAQEEPRRAAPWRAPLFFALAVIAFVAWVQCRTISMTDPDGFYHFGHARLYVERGVFWRDFPHAAFSIIGVRRADLWYGFHVLLLPFTGFSDPVWGVKAACVALLATTMLLCGAAFRDLGARAFWFWPFAIVLAGSEGLWRFLMLRPHVLSLGLHLLLFAAVLSGKAWRVGVACAAMAFVHLTTAWVAVLVMVPTLLVRGVVAKRWSARELGFALGGLTLGALARPGAFDALQLLRVQLIELGQVRAQNLDLDGSPELLPIPRGALLFDEGPFLVLWLLVLGASAFVMWRRRPDLSVEQRAALWSAGILSVLFFEMTTLLASRTLDLWMAFGVTFMALAFSSLVPAPRADLARPLLSRAAALGTLAWTPVAGWTLYQNGIDMEYEGIYPYRLRASAQWLAQNTPANSIVMHTNWTMFAELFFWNRHNRYIGGMDPIFQYSFSRERFWQAYFLSGNGDPRFTFSDLKKERPIPVEVALQRDFRSSTLILLRPLQPQLDAYLRSNPRFRAAYDDPFGPAIFQLQPI